MKKYYFLIVKKYQVGSSSEYAGNIFDLTKACSECKTGAQVMAPHKLKNIKESYDKHIFQSNTRDYFISKRLYEYFKKKNIEVSDLLPTVNQKGIPLPFYHLTSIKIFPKAKSYKGFIQYKDHCPVCCRDNYSRKAQIGDSLEKKAFIAEEIQYLYNNVDSNFLEGTDIFNTWECTARSILDKDGNIKVLPKPMLIISDKVKDALSSFGINYVETWEVKFE